MSTDVSTDRSVDMSTDISVEGCTKYTWSEMGSFVDHVYFVQPSTDMSVDISTDIYRPRYRFAIIRYTTKFYTMKLPLKCKKYTLRVEIRCRNLPQQLLLLNVESKNHSSTTSIHSKINKINLKILYSTISVKMVNALYKVWKQMMINKNQS